MSLMSFCVHLAYSLSPFFPYAWCPLASPDPFVIKVQQTNQVSFRKCSFLFLCMEAKHTYLYTIVTEKKI